MILEQRVTAFCELGKRLQTLSEDDLLLLIDKIKSENAWFTASSIRMALEGIVTLVEEKSLRVWISGYDLHYTTPKTIALVMAGNIPFVGFHDLLCVLISGNNALVKLSSKDSASIQFLAGLLLSIEPDFKNRITFTERLKKFDAVIATGSDNSSRYFDFYFSKYPHIIRKNRTSCAIFNGMETAAEFEKLGEDVFSYYGLGCRNVSKVYVPTGYNFSPMLDRWEIFKEVGNHHKYANNYDYQKSIMLVNGVRFLDNGFVMLTESEKSVSPISVLYYEYYASQEELEKKIEAVNDKLQCIMGNTKPATIPFGQAQYPHVFDYADQVDTLQFLRLLVDSPQTTERNEELGTR